MIHKELINICQFLHRAVNIGFACHVRQYMKVKHVSDCGFKYVYSFIWCVGREYQDAKLLKEANDSNVRKDTEHLEVNRKKKLFNLFTCFFPKDHDQK